MYLKLDTKDRKLIQQLELNVRQSNRQISKKIGLSKDAVAYRIRKLENQGLISNYYSIINVSKLGLMQFKIFITFQNTDTKIETEIIEYLKKEENTGWVVSCDGYYNLMIVVWSKNTFTFDTFFAKLLNKYSPYFKERDVVVIPEEYAFRNSYLYLSEKIAPISYYGGEPTFNLDKKDIIIIEALANNSKETLNNLSSKTKLTSEGVANRIKKLQRDEVLLAFRPQLKTNLLGYSLYNILFRLKKVNNLNKIFEFFKANPNIAYLSKYIGTYDLGIDLHVQNQDELRKFISGFKDHFKDEVESYSSILINQEHKLSYFPQNLHN